MLPKSLQNLIGELKKLPGVGHRSAERMAFHLIRSHGSIRDSLSNALLKIGDEVHFCKECFNISEKNICNICGNPKRDRTIICVVEEITDALAIDKTHDYKGLYHVLHGKISPLNGMGPDDLKIRELVARIKRMTQENSKNEPLEIILAMNPDMEGETTALYLAKVLKPLGVRLTRIARGIPVGSDLEFADQVTLSRALEGRQEF